MGLVMPPVEEASYETDRRARAENKLEADDTDHLRVAHALLRPVRQICELA